MAPANRRLPVIIAIAAVLGFAATVSGWLPLQIVGGILVVGAIMAPMVWAATHPSPTSNDRQASTQVRLEAEIADLQRRVADLTERVRRDGEVGDSNVVSSKSTRTAIPRRAPVRKRSA